MLDTLRARARDAATRSHVPYSSQPDGAAVLLASGRVLGAPRLENASFPLTITATQGALALALLAGEPAVAVARHRGLEDADLAALRQALGGGWTSEGASVVVRGDVPDRALEDAPGTSAPDDLDAATALALVAAARAVVPASGFRVGAVVEDHAGRYVTGANVEVAGDWTRGLCAERVALVRARALGLGPVSRVAVACAAAPGGTPCGGCRQVLAELAPGCQVVVWRDGDAPDVTTPEALLPGVFTAEALR